MSRIRIGHGYDVHRFTEGNEVVLGGVHIPHQRALLAHSDGDVVIHAIMDAVLGALALGDIGHHFPDTDAQWAGADSCAMLTHVVQTMHQRGYRIGNLDVTVIAQQPKLAPHIATMRQRIAEVLIAELDAVNVKATTTEKLGFVGREEGIATHAVVLLEAC